MKPEKMIEELECMRTTIVNVMEDLLDMRIDIDILLKDLRIETIEDCYKEKK